MYVCVLYKTIDNSVCACANAICVKKRKGNVLFNDTLKTFYFHKYSICHMVKDHSDSEKGNLLPPHRLPFTINSKGSFIMHYPTEKIAHTMAFVTPVMEHWLEREIAHEGSIQLPIAL